MSFSQIVILLYAQVRGRKGKRSDGWAERVPQTELILLMHFESPRHTEILYTVVPPVNVDMDMMHSPPGLCSMVMYLEVRYGRIEVLTDLVSHLKNLVVKRQDPKRCAGVIRFPNPVSTLLVYEEQAGVSSHIFFVLERLIIAVAGMLNTTNSIASLISIVQPRFENTPHRNHWVQHLNYPHNLEYPHTKLHHAPVPLAFTKSSNLHP